DVLSQTEVGGGVVQFLLPPYAPVLGSREPDFDESARLLIECIDSQRSAGVVIHRLSELSMVSIDARLHAYIAGLPEERVIYLGDGTREAFEALPR
nr:hypothetical protein [Myxococcota bacterium]